MADPEEYSWEVSLGEGQELELIDERHAQVYYTEGHHPAFGISATAAHDAEGSNVPTSLRVSGGNIITLTVHHRAGDPATGGAAFTYPVAGGEGWIGGFATHQVQMPSAEPSLGGTVGQAAVNCIVPRLVGESLKAAREKLKKVDCKLGKVRGERSKTARVTRQSPKPGGVLTGGAKVSVRLSG